MTDCVTDGDHECMRSALDWMSLNSILFMKRSVEGTEMLYS